jgi:hypothetical protein
MQSLHGRNLPIDAPPQPPPCFMGIVEKGSSLSQEAKAFDRLELPSCRYPTYPSPKVQILLTSTSGFRKM